MDSWWYPWQLSCFTLQPTATILAIKIRWNIELYDRNSSTTLVWRYGFWKSVHAALWSWQPGCHNINYEQNWSSLTHISIFGLYSGVFFVFFWARYNFQRLCATWRSQFGVKPMFPMPQTHPQLGGVGQVCMLSVMNFMDRGGSKKCVQNQAGLKKKVAGASAFFT